MGSYGWFPGFPGFVQIIHLFKISPGNHWCWSFAIIMGEHGPQGVTSIRLFFAHNLRLKFTHTTELAQIPNHQGFPNLSWKSIPSGKTSTNNLDIHESNLNRVRSSLTHLKIASSKTPSSQSSPVSPGLRRVVMRKSLGWIVCIPAKGGQAAYNLLVGGFNPFEKILVKMDHFPK